MSPCLMLVSLFTRIMGTATAVEQRRFCIFPLMQLQLVSVWSQSVDASWQTDWPDGFQGDGLWRLWWHGRSGASVCLNGDWQALPADHVVMIPPGTAFTVRAERAVPQLVLHARSATADGVLEHLLRGHCYPIACDLSQNAMITGIRACDEQEPDQDAVIGNLALALFHLSLARICESLPADAQRRMQHSSSDPEVLQLIRDIVAEPAADWNNSRLAERAGCSVNQLIKRFRQVSTCTPAQFVLLQRLRAAERLLRESSESIDRIAQLCGFADRYHFAHRFGAVYGCGPAKYRRHAAQDSFVHLVPPTAR
jgi:AraC-like DNA-binding protein